MVASSGFNVTAGSSQNHNNQGVVLTASPKSSSRTRLGKMTREETSNIGSDDLQAAGRRKSHSRRTNSSSKTKRHLPKTEPKMQMHDAAEMSPTHSATYVRQSDASMFKDPESQLIEIREQLVALKVRNRDLEEELAKANAKLKKRREAIQNLEEDNTDIQHDLAESKRICARMEKENRLLRKKVMKRDDENHQLTVRIESLMEVTCNESNDKILDYDDPDENRDFQKECYKPKVKTQRGSVWQLLAEETLHEASSPTVESKGGLLEHFFRSSSTIASLTDTSVMSPTSAKCTYRSQRSLTSQRGGCA